MGDSGRRLSVAGSLWSVAAEHQLAAVVSLQSSGLRRLHWDTTDGRFAAAGGFTPTQAADISRKAGTSAEAHLMAEQPLRVIDAWAEVCDTVVVHAESQDWQRAVDRLERRGCRPGLAISPDTPAGVVPLDLPVLVMSVVPGRAGSSFDTTVLQKIAVLHEQNPDRPIGLDGGVTRDRVDAAVAAGATWLVVGTDLFSPGGGARWSDVLARS